MFLLLITGFGVWLGIRVNQAHQQKAAIEQVRALGGRVVFDFEYDPNAPPPEPTWLGALVPSEYIDEVKVVTFIRSPVSDDDLALFEHLPSVERIILSECENLTGDGFQHVRRLPDLKSLYVHATPITDEGIVHVKDLRQLESLFLFCACTDKGVEMLSHMDWLSELQVGSKHISSRWNKDLRERLPNCEIAVGRTMY